MFLLIYLIINILFLAYVRLRDVNKLSGLNIIYKIIFVSFIGIFALPLQVIYYSKAKLLNKSNSKKEYNGI